MVWILIACFLFLFWFIFFRKDPDEMPSGCTLLILGIVGLILIGYFIYTLISDFL